MGPSEQKMPEIKNGHMNSCVKLNFTVDLFSCIFYSRPSSAVFLVFYIYLYFILHGKNGQNKPENRQNKSMAKIAPKSDKFTK